VRGEVRVRSYAQDPEALLQHRCWTLLSPQGAHSRVEVVKAQRNGATLRVALAGVLDRDAAGRLRDSEILLERAALPAIGAHEFYQDDLLGFSVRNTAGALLGELVHFLEAPAGTLMVVRAGERERWLPAQPPRLRRIDPQQREIVIDWPEDF
jgi:16S rRNA processing protein RimM